MTRAYILTTRYIDGLFFLFCLDPQSNPITLCVVEHYTYLYAKSLKKHDCRPRELEGEKIAIKLALEGIKQPQDIEMIRFNDAHHYSEHATPHYKVHTKGYKEMLKAKERLRGKSYSIAEYPSEEAKFFSDMKMRPCQWIEFNEEETEPITIREYETFRPIKELAIRSSSIRSYTTDELPPRVLELTFDAETYSPKYGINGSLAMPDPLVGDNILYALSIILTWSDSDVPIKTMCLCVHNDDIRTSNDTEEVRSTPSEEELYKEFFNIVRYYDPEILLGHNSSCYDFGYISKRTVTSDIPLLGRLNSFEQDVHLGGNDYTIKLDLPDNEEYKTHSWEGAGGIWHEYVMPNCYGRIILDTLIILKKLETSPGTPGKLQSHSLKDLGKFLVGESKADMSYAETFYAYRSGDTRRIADICSYCIQDSRLCMKIFHKTKSWIAVRESSSIFYQDANNVTITGQTMKSYTNFLRTAEEKGFAFHPISHLQVKVKGGHVEKPVKGKHTNVIVLDFASMYPTAQEAFNICPSTYSKIPPAGCTADEYVELKIPVQVGEQELPARYEDYMGINDEDFDIERIDDLNYIDAVMKQNQFNPDYRASFIQMVRRDHDLPVKEVFQDLTVYFVKSSKRKGVLPVIQERLSIERGIYKKKMKEAEKRAKGYKETGDKQAESDALIEAEMFNQRQALVKVVRNSIYGCLGAAVGRMSFPAGAAAITYVGRTQIGNVRKYLVDEGCKIIYGDTDSLMFQVAGYNDESPLLSAAISDEVLKEGGRLAETINATLPHPMEMEFEKVINAIFIDKKRYTGFITWPEHKMFVRGAASVRGDTAPFARRLYTTVLSAIIEDKPKEEIDTLLANELRPLYTGEVPNNMLSVSKMLSHSYVSPSAPMNVYAKYLLSIGETAEAGTKIPLIVTKQQRAGPRALSYRLPTTEEPIDYEYYAEMAKRPLNKLIHAAYLGAGDDGESNDDE